MEAKRFLKKIRNGFVILKVKMGRGLALIDTFREVILFETYAGLLTELLNKAFGLTISLSGVLALTPIIALGLILLGHFDIKYFHTLQKENEYTTILNPILNKMNHRIKHLSKGRKQKHKKNGNTRTIRSEKSRN